MRKKTGVSVTVREDDVGNMAVDGVKSRKVGKVVFVLLP